MNYIVGVIGGLILFNCLAQNSNAQANKNLVIAHDIVETALKFHYNPRPIDDEFADLVFHSILKDIDSKGFILTMEDVSQLENLKSEIDDDILNTKGTFVNALFKIWANRLLEADSIIRCFENTRFDFKQKDSLKLSSKQVFVEEKFLKRKWEQWIKYQILHSFISRTADSITPTEVLFEQARLKLQHEVVLKESCRVRGAINSETASEQFVTDIYLKAIANAFDPHTSYLSEIEQTEFENDLSEQKLSFGFYLGRNDVGEFEISALVPGTTAWKCGQIHERDIILSITTNKYGKKDLYCTSYQEVSQLLVDKDVQEATLYLRNRNGKEEQITLKKETVDVAENVIRGFVCEGNRRIGYLNLPSFYQSAGLTTQRGCADDVAKELIRLKADGIEGLIFDLRDNGGGSLNEAIKMVGLFIDYGSVTVIDSKGGIPFSLKDGNRGTVFDGPMLVLVNSNSASASELFAAALQDYHRAIIVGTATYGKSTSQIIIPADGYRYSDLDLASNAKDVSAFLKLTTGAFYRISGQSHQGEGVMPDIIIPDECENLSFHEKDEPSALKLTPITKKTYYTVYANLPISDLNVQSKARINLDKRYERIHKKALEYQQYQYNITIPLTFSSYEQFYRRLNRGNDHDPIGGNVDFTVKNTAYLTGVSSIENSDVEINSDLMHSLENDPSVIESYHIVNDLININSK